MSARRVSLPPSAPSLNSLRLLRLSTPQNARFWHIRVLLPPQLPRQREELGEGVTGARTFGTHALPSLDPPFDFHVSLTPGNPRFGHLGVPLPLPETPGARRSGGVGGTGWFTDRIYGSRGSRLKLFASLEPGLVEIRAVALRNVAIKGVQSVRYLCMGADGRLLGLVGVTTGRDALACGT